MFALGALVIALLLSAAVDAVAADPQPTDFPKFTNRKPYQRGLWLLKQRSFPLDETPDGALVRAYEQLKAFAPPGGALPMQPVSGDRWIPIGPSPILRGQIGFTGRTRDMSGRVSDVVVHPTQPNHWLVSGAFGGVWRTLDAGNTWTPLTDDQPSQAVGAIAFAASNPNIIYVGTGEGVFSGDAFAGVGLLKSTDGGTTWQLLAESTFNKRSFSDIRVNPANPNVVVAATVEGASGRFGSPGPANPPPTGVFRSLDGGVTWTRTLGGQATDLEVSPADFNIQYAGLGFVVPSATNGVYRSTNAGATWTLLPGPWSALAGGVGRIELALAPSSPNTLYVSIQDGFNGTINDGRLLGIWRTDNAQAASPTWVQLLDPPSAGQPGVNSVGEQCWYDHEIIVDPANPGVLYFGEVNLWRFNGSAWQDISRMFGATPQLGIHADQHAMAWSGNRLIIGNDGGVWSTTDNGGSFADHNTNLSITQYYDGSLHPTDPNFAIGGTQDNGTQLWRGMLGWEWIFGGDGCANAISAEDPDNDWAVSSQFLSIARTTDGGVTFIKGDTGIDKTFAPFIARFEKSPTVNDVMIAGTDRLWRTDSFWTAAIPSWTVNGPAMGADITALAFAASDDMAETYAFGTGEGEVRITADGGQTWLNPDPANTLPVRYVADLAFNPTNASELYVCLSGFDEGTPGRPGHVFRTGNAFDPAPAWQNVSPPVNLPANTIAIDPFDANILYVGTDLGVWKSTDAGATWNPMGPAQGLPNVAVFDLQINHDTDRLVAFTHGRGAYRLQSSPMGVSIADLAVSIMASPNPVTVGQTLTYSIGLTNLGPSNAVNVAVTNILPAGVTFINAVSSMGTPVFAGGMVTLDLPALGAAEGATLTIQISPQSIGIVTNSVTVASADFDPNLLNNSAAAVVDVTGVGGSQLLAGGSLLAAEGFAPPNGAVDPSETVTVEFGIRNVGSGDSPAVTVQLLPGGGVANPSAQQSYGTIPAGGEVSRPFSFVAFGTGGGTVTASLAVRDGATLVATLTYTFQLSRSDTFVNPAAITINPVNAAVPYPSALQVAGMQGLVSKVRVRLNKFQHSFPDDVDVLLVGPAGQKVMLMSDAGGNSAIAAGINLTFDSDAPASLPDVGALVGGTFRPTDHEPGETLPGSAPAAPYGTSLAVFNNQSANGNWSLFVADDTEGDAGTIVGGWELELTTFNPLNPAGDLAVMTMASTATPLSGLPFTYTVTAKNMGAGPVPIVVSNQLPAGVTLNSNTVSQGSAIVSGSVLTASFGTVAPGGMATLTLNVTANAPGSLTNTATVTGPLADINPANNTATTIVTAMPPAPLLQAGAAMLLSEGFNPPNGGVDAAEVVAMNFELRNVGSATAINVQATLLATGGVASPGAPQNYGTLTPGAPPTGRAFTFTAAPAGSVITATLQLTINGAAAGNVQFPVTIGASGGVTNATAIVIPALGAASPYPSTIQISGVTGTVTRVTATLHRLSHGYANDLDVLLVGPGGQKVMLMSDAGGNSSPSNATLTFDDAAAGTLPQNGNVVTGMFKPSNFAPAETLPAPAPAPPYGASFSAFNGGSPNGTWSLFVSDAISGDSGVIAGGWSLSVQTIAAVNPASDLRLTALASAGSVVVGSNVTYTLTVSNRGPGTASSVLLTNLAPAAATLLSVTPSQGTVTTNGSVVRVALGGLANGANATIALQVRPFAVVNMTNSAVVAAALADLVPGDNSVLLTTTVLPPPAPSVAVSGVVGNQFQLAINGVNGVAYVIEASANLTQWTPISTNILMGATLTFSDPASTTEPTRFYRARVLGQ